MEVLADYTTRIADDLAVQGPINVQFAVKSGDVFVIEANPRASRTVPFVSKATGRPMAKVAARVMAGATLVELRAEGLLAAEPVSGHWSVKEAVLPFNRFPNSDALLGPEMRSTGEVMGVDTDPGLAFLKSQLAAGSDLSRRLSGAVFLSLADRDKPTGIETAELFARLGFPLMATAGTATALEASGLKVEQVVERLGGDGPDAVKLITSGAIAIVINTPRGRGARADGDYIRMTAAQHGTTLLTTVAAARAAANGLLAFSSGRLEVRSLQSIHRGER
jgi:carbamoyl-phosphate synthase large subunit